jgi:hypothetical protein
VLDEETRTVVEGNDGHEQLTGPCNVRRRDYPRTNGVATSLAESLNTTTEVITCEASDWFGTCYWQLRREPGGFNHGIGRVLDDNGTEQEVTQACSSAAVPQFIGTSADAIHEQGAFYLENQMRFYTDQNVWSQVAFTQRANVRITVDNASVNTAVFNDFTTDIDCNPGCFLNGQGNPAVNCCAQEVLAHEYGHYVDWSYGGNITHNQVRAMMRARIATDSGAATATRAQRIFSHHGLTCPACCAGC